MLAQEPQTSIPTFTLLKSISQKDNKNSPQTVRQSALDFDHIVTIIIYSNMYSTLILTKTYTYNIIAARSAHRWRDSSQFSHCIHFIPKSNLTNRVTAFLQVLQESCISFLEEIAAALCNYAGKYIWMCIEWKQWAIWALRLLFLCNYSMPILNNGSV